MPSIFFILEALFCASQVQLFSFLGARRNTMIFLEAESYVQGSTDLVCINTNNMFTAQEQFWS